MTASFTVFACFLAGTVSAWRHAVHRAVTPCTIALCLCWVASWVASWGARSLLLCAKCCMRRREHNACSGRSWGAATLRCAVVLSLLRDARGQSSCTPGLYEAEDAAASGPKQESKHKGYTGSGFMDYAANFGDYLEWTVSASVPTRADATGRYALARDYQRDLSLSMNGVTIQTVSFPGIGSWADYGNTTGVMVTLSSKSNTIRLTANGTSGGNLDGKEKPNQVCWGVPVPSMIHL